jgi:hypothetical protein
MKVIHIFVEEPSIKQVLDEVIPKVLPENVYFTVYPHQGKQDLEKAIRSTIPTISKTEGARIIICRDQDSALCREVKQKIIELVNGNIFCHFKVRIVCKELESWFLGDLDAVSNAYPRFNPDSISGKAKLRNVDEIVNPAQYLLKSIPELVHKEHLPKIENARKIAPFLTIEGNYSKSFIQMIEAVKYLASI